MALAAGVPFEIALRQATTRILPWRQPDSRPHGRLDSSADSVRRLT